MRTRHDKTESVQKFQKKYGNNQHIAGLIWRSIQNNITMDDIIELAGTNYKAAVKRLEESLSKDIMYINRNQDAYYQNNDRLSKPWRNWHNYITSHLITTYCSGRKVNGRHYKMRVLDMGVGRGGAMARPSARRPGAVAVRFYLRGGMGATHRHPQWRRRLRRGVGMARPRGG